VSKPEAYKSTPVFDEKSLPQALQSAHSTKTGTWGLLELLAGELVYVIEESGNSRHMQAGDKQIIEPQQLHHVELVGPMQMQVHFFREKPG
jgi:hemoglobin